MKRIDRRLARRQEGVVYVEFLVSFVPLFVLCLGITQVALIFPAKLVVDHAAYRAARSASVVLDDDPRYYEGDLGGGFDRQFELRNTFRGAPLGEADLRGALARLHAMGTGAPARTRLSRRATVELAAAVVLSSLAFSRPGSVRGALSPASLGDKAAQTLDAMDVSLHVDGSPAQSFARDDEITVRVEYVYRCPIPLAGRLVCPGGARTLSAEATMANHAARYPYLQPAE